MKIAFIWPWERASETYPNWRDGLRAALEELEKEHTVQYFFNGVLPDQPYDFDFVLVWDDSNTSVTSFIKDLKEYPSARSPRFGLCLTTDPNNIENLKNFDVVYCESEPIYQAVRSQGLRAIKAFGTDSNFYCPDDSVAKDREYFYPATFSPWKQQDTIAYLGKDLTCLGTIQPDGNQIYQDCVNNNVNTIVGYLYPTEVRDLYRRARRVIIPAVHGSERTTLEAMSMDIPIETTLTTNEKVMSLVYEQMGSKLKPRDFILKNYSGEKYAEALLKGMHE